jgi:SAM-dependent methyltransferase
MSLGAEYRAQRRWRDGAAIFDAVPPVRGRLVLDLGCGVGDQSAELVARGARVIGIDGNEELLREARSRSLPNAEFLRHDLGALPDLEVSADGLWCGFLAAYFPDLPTALRAWTKHLRPGGWIALTEIDDLFGHEPLGVETRTIFETYARESLAANRYDFHMGHKLARYAAEAGLAVEGELTVEDRELSFDGPALPEVVHAWRQRLDRLKPLRDVAGGRFERVREEFLSCLQSDDHSSTAKVYVCIAMARRPG